MFTLIDLPYALDALEPVISARTLEFHHGKHLAGYVANLNRLIAGTGFEGLPLEEIVLASAPVKTAGAIGSPSAVFNNAGQILNHNMYFAQFRAPGAGPEGPAGALSAQIAKQWGSLEALQAEFEAKGAGLFGSGWVWLSADKAGALHITQEPGAFNPIVRGLKPLLTFDVWEHAYYLDYQNRRPDHLKALWSIVDWDVVGERYATND